MRSRTEWLERALRGLGLLALVGALASTARPSRVLMPPSVDSLRVVQRALDSNLVDAITRGALLPSQLLLRVVPDDTARALLHAARDAGLPFGWSVDAGVSLPALGVSAQGVSAPVGQTTVRASAGNAPWLTLHDDIGWVDSVSAPRDDVIWTLPSSSGSWCVKSAAARACARSAVSSRRPRVRVYGAPGWELQFTHTSRYAAVVALDSTSWPDAAAIARFVREGGGLIVLAWRHSDLSDPPCLVRCAARRRSTASRCNRRASCPMRRSYSNAAHAPANRRCCSRDGLGRGVSCKLACVTSGCGA
ncbi:MAG: hypothetical protein MUD17_13980 [Gemmatimonadaceae bacterium]|nr:hypothetical protein [Gemmatimonadaceae bacterium]